MLVGSFAAYALVRIQYRVKLGNVAAFLVLLGLTVYAVTSLGAPWFAAAAVAIILFIFFVTAVGRYFRRALGNDDILFWIISNRILLPVVVVLPLARPGLAATSLLILILAWNEYLLALFISTADAQTMPMLVAAQNATRGPQWWYMSVLIVIMIAPIVLTAALLQRHIARGLLVGAVKG